MQKTKRTTEQLSDSFQYVKVLLRRKVMIHPGEWCTVCGDQYAYLRKFPDLKDPCSSNVVNMICAHLWKYI